MADHQLTKDDIHHVLSNKRRRIAIDALRENGEEMEVRELSEQIAALETGEKPPPRNAYESAYVSLHQNHLPRLDDLGIVDYDAAGKRVELQDSIDQVTVYMRTVPKYGISWSEYYIGLTVVSLLLIVSSEIGVPVLSLISGITWAYLSLSMIVASALYQTYRQESSIIHRWRA